MPGPGHRDRHQHQRRRRVRGEDRGPGLDGGAGAGDPRRWPRRPAAIVRPPSRVATTSRRKSSCGVEPRPVEPAAAQDRPGDERPRRRSRRRTAPRRGSSRPPVRFAAALATTMPPARPGHQPPRGQREQRHRRGRPPGQKAATGSPAGRKATAPTPASVDRDEEGRRRQATAPGPRSSCAQCRGGGRAPATSHARREPARDPPDLGRPAPGCITVRACWSPSASGSSSSSCESGRDRLEYTEYGSGDAWVVLLHGQLMPRRMHAAAGPRAGRRGPARRHPRPARPRSLRPARRPARLLDDRLRRAGGRAARPPRGRPGGRRRHLAGRQRLARGRRDRARSGCAG